MLVGLGTGHLVRVFDRVGIKTDILEIDPEVDRAAQDYFNFKSDGELLLGDACYQISRLEKQYDLMIHDCFTGGSEPIHLLSLEMLQALKKNLKQYGLLVLNMVGFDQGPEHQPIAAMARTLKELFTFQRVFVSLSDSRFNDYVFMVSNAPLELTSTPSDARVARWLKNRERYIDTRNAVLITDDYNPLESLQVKKAEQYRSVLKNRLVPEILLR